MNPRDKKFAIMIGFSAIVLSIFIPSAQATISFANGNFSALSCGTLQSGQTCTNGAGQLDFNTDATDWTNGTTGNLGYTFLFPSTTAATTSPGATGVDGALELWGLGNGSDNPGNALTGSSIPGGGNFIASDGSYEIEALSQTITGLTNGDTYVVGFWWAGAQQEGVNYTAPTTEQWQVSLGSQTQSTAFVDNAGEGFTGWMYQTLTFTATGTSEALSFLANGTPGSSEPPFVLLADVSFTQTPEPGTLTMMLGGFGLIGMGLFKSKRWFKR